ncbi:tyrosine-type recombinase/integrase [Georgenia sp. M64]|uniref:tyrosine-type recombinase/integrase n=1 Tax=Georgenia sp. M64 TaxID=3120520 RepID=UPI0030E15F91
MNGRPETWGAAIEAYARYQRAGGRALGTIRVHRSYLGRLRTVASSPWTATTGDLVTFLAAGDWKPDTRKSARSALVTFYRWAIDMGHCETSPAERLPGIKVPTAAPRPATDEAIAAALARATPDVRLMILFGAFAGLRCAEISAVHHDDLRDGLLYVNGKGGKLRAVPLEHPELLAAVAAARSWLFPSPYGVDQHVTPGHVVHHLSAVLPAGVTGHQLRHRFATAAYAGTRDMLAVGQLLGHSKPETTQRYVRLPDDAIRAAVRSAAGLGATPPAAPSGRHLRAVPREETA